MYRFFYFIMAKRQFYGIKFPITIKSERKTALDLCETPSEKITSELMHLIFTPKRQKLRDPDFGTDLIQYIFSPNDSQTWDDVMSEIKTKVSRYIPQCDIKDIQIVMSDDGLGIYAKITYSVTINGNETTNEIMTKL